MDRRYFLQAALATSAGSFLFPDSPRLDAAAAAQSLPVTSTLSGCIACSLRIRRRRTRRCTNSLKPVATTTILRSGVSLSPRPLARLLQRDVPCDQPGTRERLPVARANGVSNFEQPSREWPRPEIPEWEPCRGERLARGVRKAKANGATGRRSGARRKYQAMNPALTTREQVRVRVRPTASAAPSRWCGFKASCGSYRR